MTDFDLPPRRALPPEVRERMRATVQEEMRGTRRGGRWVFVAAAAAVVLLVAGAVSVSQLVRPAQVPVAASSPPAGSVDRCWSAVEVAGKTSSIPPRRQWVVTHSDAKGDDAVIGLKAGELRMFCETTRTSVTVSDPHAAPRYAPDGKTAMLLATQTGLVAGVTDPATYQGMDLYQGELGATMSLVAPTGEFSAYTGLNPAKTPLSSWGRSGATREKAGNYVGKAGLLPLAPPPLLTVDDRGVDRTSGAGAALGECLAKAPEKPANANAYEPGVLLQDGQYQVVLGKLGLDAVACTSEPDLAKPGSKIYIAYSNTFIGLSVPVKRLSVAPLGADQARIPFVGIVPDDTTKLTTDVGVGHPVPAEVAGGTFGMWLPAGAQPPAGDGMAWVKSENANGTPSFNGWIPFK